MSLVLAIDIGNSRMKWGIHGQHGWRVQGVIPNAEIGTLALRDWHNLPRPWRVVGVNVAGEAARVRLEAQLARWRLVPEWLGSTEAACGVTRTLGSENSELAAGSQWARLAGSSSGSSRPAAATRPATSAS